MQEALSRGFATKDIFRHQLREGMFEGMVGALLSVFALMRTQHMSLTSEISLSVGLVLSLAGSLPTASVAAFCLKKWDLNFEDYYEVLAQKRQCSKFQKYRRSMVTMAAGPILGWLVLCQPNSGQDESRNNAWVDVEVVVGREVRILPIFAVCLLMLCVLVAHLCGPICPALRKYQSVDITRHIFAGVFTMLALAPNPQDVFPESILDSILARWICIPGWQVRHFVVVQDLWLFGLYGIGFLQIATYSEEFHFAWRKMPPWNPEFTWNWELLRSQEVRQSLLIFFGFLSALLLACGDYCFPAQGFDFDGYYKPGRYKTGRSRVDLRAEPDLDLDIITRFPKDSIVEIEEVKKVEPDFWMNEPEFFGRVQDPPGWIHLNATTRVFQTDSSDSSDIIRFYVIRLIRRPGWPHSLTCVSPVTAWVPENQGPQITVEIRRQMRRLSWRTWNCWRIVVT